MSAPTPRARPPWRATYRLQLTPEFGFADAAAMVPYLEELGISHLYLSPVLESVAGSTHGYDGTDPTAISAERGGEAAFRDLVASAHAHGLGVLLDIVPNHLAASDETPWWRDPEERARTFDTDPTTGWYRRFFDIDGLAGVRQEDPEVFERTHAKVLELVADGLVDGLRIDHPDGLTDPVGYLAQLHEAAGVPIWVEKVLHTGERLRPWPVAGTVGYEFANDVTALFADSEGEAPITRLYQELTGDRSDFDEVAAAAKREQLDGPFARELDRLVELAPDLDRDDLAAAVVGLPVYRTYVRPADGAVDPRDRALIEASGAGEELRARLLLDAPAPAELITRYQQLTAPIAAKGIEDTAFYRSIRLLAHNEVGGDPTRFSIEPDAFHAACLERAGSHPHELLAATTHDTKRSADTRARLVALTSMADAFEVHARRWFELTEPLVADGAPTPLERWYLFQTLVGSWPLTADRLEGHLIKAMREAKLATSWIDPDEAHERAVLAFARAIYEVPALWTDLGPFAHEVAARAERISVGQALLRATAPGTCDVYQGDETWFLSLVDPDVRRPTDAEGRRRQLERVRATDVPTRATAKLHVLQRALDLRRRRPTTFEDRYEPVPAGSATVAYLRGDDVLVVVPLRPDPSADPSAEVDVPAGIWRDVLHGGERRLGGPEGVASLVGPLGVGLWERA